MPFGSRALQKCWNGENIAVRQRLKLAACPIGEKWSCVLVPLLQNTVFLITNRFYAQKFQLLVFAGRFGHHALLCLPEGDAARSKKQFVLNVRFDFKPDHDGGVIQATTPGQPCGCPLPDNVRKPSGCVTVFDNVLPNNHWDAVREVKVLVSRTQFFGWAFHQHGGDQRQGLLGNQSQTPQKD